MEIAPSVIRIEHTVQINNSKSKKQTSSIIEIYCRMCPIWLDCLAQHIHRRDALLNTGKPEILLLPTHYECVCNRSSNRSIDWSTINIYVTLRLFFIFSDSFFSISISFSLLLSIGLRFFSRFLHRSQFIIRSGAFPIPFFVCVNLKLLDFQVVDFFFLFLQIFDTISN